MVEVGMKAKTDALSLSLRSLWGAGLYFARLGQALTGGLEIGVKAQGLRELADGLIGLAEG